MKKRVRFRKLNRTPAHKWAMLRTMVTQLIEHERIVTTLAKAKELQKLAENVITTAKKGLTNKLNHDDPNIAVLHARRRINRTVRTAHAQTKVINVLGPRYLHREGGYTRIMKLAKPRRGDNASMAVMEYVDRPGEIRAARPPAILREEFTKLLLLQQQQQQPKRADSIATDDDSGGSVEEADYDEDGGESRGDSTAATTAAVGGGVSPESLEQILKKLRIVDHTDQILLDDGAIEGDKLSSSEEETQKLEREVEKEGEEQDNKKG